MSDNANPAAGTLSPAERLDALESEGVVSVDDEAVTLTLEFESTRGIYHDSYIDVPEAEYHQAVSDVFGIDPDEAADRIEELGVTREQFVALLALNSHVDGEYPLVERANMAMMITDIAPPSPVPEDVTEIDDDSFEAFLEEHDRAAVTVWKRFCDPCDRMKADLGETASAFPEGVAVAGIDGEATTEFRRRFEVEAAPSVLLFEGGECRESLRGYHSPEDIADACADVYDE
ncbi:thioredoxin [Natronomonas moolapensis 8.8.11]|uniref:Thioredoxin n=1 Tax=Natronomonas moolapensis (strain DSM 18674 / CECT 7526 / JCM 14361 / 8.8.11) TaxID=268739 RepID=M1XTM8_NATM8|nr:thioredoxin family protein [Natronomonas moolapensis]CCQ37794.1 thioredoxin [Natronomonas moolapensis 8.8.11]